MRKKNEQINQLEKEINELERTIALLEKAPEDLLEAQIQWYSTTYPEYFAELEANISEEIQMSDFIQLLVKKIAETKAALAKELTSEQSKVKDLTENLRNTTKSLNAKATEINFLNSQLEELRVDTKLSIETKDKQIKALETQIDETKKEKDSLAENLSFEKLKNFRLLKQVESRPTRKDYKDLSRQKEELIQEINESQQELKKQCNKHQQQQATNQGLKTKNRKIATKLGKQIINIQNLVKTKSEIEITRDNLLYEKEQHQTELKKSREQISENSSEIIRLRDEIANLTKDKDQLTINSQQLENSHQEIITNICLSLELTAKATQADILAKIASLMKRPDAEVVSQKDQVISEYSAKLATSENLITAIKQQVQTTQTTLAISVGLGSLTACFLLIYLVLLKRKYSTLKRIRG